MQMSEFVKPEDTLTMPESARPEQDSRDRNLSLLSWLVDYELRSAERYRRFVALLMVSAASGHHRLKELLLKTKRGSDRCVDLGEEYAILMSETDLMGALAAVGRYKAVFSEKFDVRFSIALFPMDGINSADLVEGAYRRLNAARMLQWGAVVNSG